MATDQRSLKRYVGRHKGAMTVSCALVAVTVSLQLLLPFLVRFVIDGLDHGTLDARELGVALGLFMGGTLLSVWTGLGMRRIPLRLGYEVERELRNDLFAHLTTLDRAFFAGHQTGDLMTRATSDLGNVRELVGQGILQGARTSLVVCLAFTIMSFISLPLTLVMLVLLPGISVLCYFVLRLIRPRHDAAQEQLSALTHFAQESLAGIRTLKGYAIEDRAAAQFGALNTEFLRRNLSLSAVERGIWPLFLFLFALGQVLLLVFGGRLVVQQRLTIGEMVQFMQYMAYMQWPMLALGWTMNLYVRGITSWKRVRALLDAKPAVCDGPWTQRSLTRLEGDLEFRHVSLTLDGQKLLDDLHVTFPEGATIGITGPTGSGKTLLACLLVRLLDPTEGQVFIGKHDLREYPLSVLRGHIGMAAQEPFLFAETLSSNILFGVEHEEATTLEWAAEVAQLHGDVETFPARYETLLGERGVTLSGGQRRRAAISRAVARNPDLLILDDVLAAVDTQTEARILERLRGVLKERTSIVISHRISSLRQADFIVVLDRGRIVQRGTHEELLRTDGYYKNLEHVQRLEAALEGPA